ncbi:Fatty acid hydroxylase [Trema orientale]|uniref:Fatty acid hydroxylase n=1 Tax=Trema orientale TaxID=63057 RepID=A0A2P5CC95_TREOI|nr:Fatty acid hydroxylase [Trema orientale]
MLHCRWAYDKIHRVHHEYTAPFGFTAPHAHWAEYFILGFGSFLGPAIVPCHMTTDWLWFILRQMEAVEVHSG